MDGLVHSLQRQAPNATFRGADLRDHAAANLVEALRRVPRVRRLTLSLFRSIGCHVACEVLKNVTTIVELYFRSCSLFQDEDEKLAEALRSCSHLKSFSFRCCSVKASVRLAIAKALVGNMTLEYLRWGYETDDNVSQAMLRSVASTHIRTLDMWCEGLNRETWGYLRDLLCTSVHLRKLRIKAMPRGAACLIAEGVEKSSSLDLLSVCTSRMVSSDLITICAALERRGRPIGLVVEDNIIDVDSMTAVARLVERDLLRRLNLSGNPYIGNVGVTMIASALQRSSLQLKHLELYNVGMTCDGMRAIADSFHQRCGLKTLDVRVDEPIDEMGVEPIVRLMGRVGSIKSLSIWANPMSAIATLMAPLDRFSSLRKLCIGDSSDDASWAAPIASAMERGLRLRYLGVDRTERTTLAEGALCSGWLLKCNDERLQPIIERNKAMHERAAQSALTLMVIRTRGRQWTRLNLFPKELIRDIAQYMFSTRGELAAWNVSDNSTKKRRTE